MAESRSTTYVPDPEPFRSPLRHAFVGCLAVVAVYTYFLLFAQFGFLTELKSTLATRDVQRALGAMGLAGLAGSFLAAWLLGRTSLIRVLSLGLLGCALTAMLAPHVRAVPALLLLAAAVGLFTGLATVALAGGLSGFFPHARLGLWAGAGTGLAYFLCNLPPVFAGTVALRSLLPAVLCLAAFIAIQVGAPRAAAAPVSTADACSLPVASMVLLFLALIALDSLAFAVIQESLELRAHSWGSAPQKFQLGVVHLAAALAGGWLIDRGRLNHLLPLTWSLFALAFVLLRAPTAAAALAGPLYALGISLYSVALVSYPSRGADPAAARRRAALVYGVSGWLGSALGAGAAQNAHAIPFSAVAGAGALMVIALITPRARPRCGAALCRPGAVSLYTLLALLGVLLCARTSPGARSDPSLTAEQRGRQVYIREGCLNCHSQYIRPHTDDVLRWGPAQPLDRAEQPPLVGNRRQGPDLLNVGNRRSAEWQRLHLLNPTSVSPGSRMPSYAHLFAGGAADGDDLVAYLMSRGAHTQQERLNAILAWMPRANAASAETGRAIFAIYCTVCHGARADGANTLDLLTRYPAMNLRKGSWMFAPAPAPAEQRAQLARIVKFGLPGTPMPGHESFSDQQVADVTAFLQTLAPAVARDSGS